jgi:hypothetical protein
VFSSLNNTPCQDNEIVTRYLNSRNQYRTSDDRIKARAFEPSNKDNLTSVFRIDNLTENQIWTLGQTYVGQPDRIIHGRADIRVNAIRALGLEVTPSEPPPRHANVSNWGNQKSFNMSLAQQIAAESNLIYNPILTA